MVTCSGTNCSTAVKTFFHQDKVGSVIAMSNADGSLAEGPYAYDAYGNCLIGGQPCSGGVPYKYTGRRYDPETGLYYYRARYYSAALGRFLQTDPVGYKDDIDWYTYVQNDPTDKTDPSGEYGAGFDFKLGEVEIGYDEPSDSLYVAGRIGPNTVTGPYANFSPSGMPAAAQDAANACASCRVTWSQTTADAGVSVGPYAYQPLNYDGDSTVTVHGQDGSSSTTTAKGEGLRLNLPKIVAQENKAPKPSGRPGNPLGSHKNPKMHNPFKLNLGGGRTWGTTFSWRDVVKGVSDALKGSVCKPYSSSSFCH